MPHATQFYHTRDPIENLLIHVTARKIAGGKTETKHTDNSPVGATVSYSFRWQEPRRSSSFKDRFGRRKKPDTGDGEEPPRNTAASRLELCSYIDADNYDPPANQREGVALTTSTASSSTHLTPTAMEQQGLRLSIYSVNRARLARRLHREERSRQMHLVLHVSDTKEELVLASLRYYSQSGLLCSTPGFSSLIDSEKHTDVSSKGPKLSTYYAVSPLTGVRYEYALDNENDLLPTIYSDDAQLLREIERVEERDELHDVNEWKIKHGDHPEGLAVATKRDATDEEQPQGLFLSLEIVSAHNVSTTEPVRVSYELHLPSKTSTNPNNHWSVEDEVGVLQGKTRLSQPCFTRSKGTTAAFGHHEEFAVFGPAGDTAPFIRPAVVLTMVSRDSWYREHLEGYAELKLPASPGFYEMNVKVWKPLQTTHDQLEDFFIGMDPSMQHRPTAVAQAASSSGVMTRFGMKTVATDASLRVRLHVVQRDSSKDLTRNVAAPTNRPISYSSMVGGGKVVKRSVQEILQALQLEKRTPTIGEASRDRTTTILGSSKENTSSAS